MTHLNNSKANKTRRRADAVERQAARDARAVSEQLKLINSRPGLSEREFARLTKGESNG